MKIAKGSVFLYLAFIMLNVTPTLAFFGSLGNTEIIVIFLLIFLLFGAKKLPELARGLGKSLGEFKKAKEEFGRELMESEQKEKEGKTEEKITPSTPANTASQENPYVGVSKDKN